MSSDIKTRPYNLSEVVFNELSHMEHLLNLIFSTCSGLQSQSSNVLKVKSSGSVEAALSEFAVGP